MTSKLQSPAGGMVDINLTSLIDVALVLVVIFMVMAPMVVQSSITISTPQAGQTAAGKQQPEAKITLYVKPDGGIRINHTAVTATTMTASLRQLLATSTTKRVEVSADERVLHEHVVAVLDAARLAGAKELTIVKPRKQ